MIILLKISQEFINPVISATAVIVGSLIGAICTWVTTKCSIRKNTEVENNIVEENRKYDKLEKTGKICENVNIIRLDICTSIFQSIRTIKKFQNNDYTNRYPIPVNKEYSKVVASLTNKFDLKEISYIYQLYAIIEVLNKHLNDLNYNDDDGYNLVFMDCELLLKKIYGENYIKILKVNIDNISYTDLYDNDLIKEGYKRVLKKLDDNSCIEKYEQN